MATRIIILWFALAMSASAQLSAVNPFFVAATVRPTTAAQTKSLEFDSATPSLADGFSVSTGSGLTFSIVGWIKPLATGNDYGSLIVQSAVGGVYYRSNAVGSANKMDLFIASDHLNSTALTVDSWNHFGITVSNDGTAGTVRFYLNGAPDGTNSVASDLTLNKIGSDLGVNALKARLVDLAVHSIVLSQTQVTNLYNKTTTSGVIGSCSAWWKFGEGTGTTANDSSGNGKHATLTGTTWATDVP